LGKGGRGGKKSINSCTTDTKKKPIVTPTLVTSEEKRRGGETGEKKKNPGVPQISIVRAEKWRKEKGNLFCSKKRGGREEGRVLGRKKR